MTSKKAILITGTIIPNSVHVVHTDVSQRMNEYRKSLIYYATLFKNDAVYFLENSSYDIEHDIQFMHLLKEQNIILIKFPPSKEFEKGKGHQEFEMLDKAIDQIKNDHEFFVKITGRYKVTNLTAIIPDQIEGIIIDCHKQPAVAQTNVFACNMNFYMTTLKGKYLEANDSTGVFIEHVVYRNLKKKDNFEHVQMFPKNPLITGISGSYGGSIARNKYKLILRNLERKALKLIGIKQFLIEY